MRNGVGVYNLPTGQPVVTGTTISATVFNTLTADLATALTTSVATDGQTAMSANLPMGGFKAIALGAATVAGDAVRFEQIGALALIQGAAASGPLATSGITGAAIAGPLATSGVTGAAASGANNDITSMTALAAGGLPDNSVLTADIANAAITAAKLSGAQTGTAPIYGCRAWANFNGTTATIRASGNIASVVRNGPGDYTVTFTTAMPDADYSALVSCQSSGSAVLTPIMFNSVIGGPSVAQTAPTASALRISVWANGATPTDSNIVLLSVFR